MPERPSTLWKAIGPGLLFAAAAVGVSHLVQSTRAGAIYGVSLFAFIIIANVLKYPAFRFGPHYAASTGTSLLEGYRRQGRWALVLYGVVTIATMFTVQAAVTVVTAGLVKAALGLEASPLVLSAGLLVVCSGVLAVGRFQWLDRIVKVLVVLFTVSTIVAAVLVLPKIPWGEMAWFPRATDFDRTTIVFLAALVGWMPSAIDISVWSSLWTLEKGRDTGHRASLSESMLDFHIGYLGTAMLALCFMVLGAGVMFTSQVEVAGPAGAFATQILNLYTETLGSWAGSLIGLSAIAVMFSTTLTVLDGFPRAISTLIERFRSEEIVGEDPERENRKRIYWIAMGVQACGALVVLFFLLTSLPALVDIATTLSFLTAPVLAFLNHRAMFQSNVPESDQPAPWLRWLSLLGIAGLSIFALYYLYLITFVT